MVVPGSEPTISRLEVFGYWSLTLRLGHGSADRTNVRPIPPYITTPNSVETRIVTLKFNVPDQKTIQMFAIRSTSDMRSKPFCSQVLRSA